jgi:rare lipoprotein A
VIVTINDRGPWVAGRDVDVSDEAARRLGIKKVGVASLLMEVLPD